MRIGKRWLDGLKSRKGSSTMEYVIVLALGLIFAGILYQTMSSDTVACKMKQAIGQALELEMAEECGKEVAGEEKGGAKQAQPPSNSLFTTTPTINPSTNPPTPESDKDSGFWSSLGDSLAKGWENTKEGASDLWDESKKVVSATWEGLKDGASAAWEWSKENWEYLAAGSVALSGIALCFVVPPLGIAVLTSGGISGGISALMGNDMDTIMADAALGGVAGLVGLGGFAAGTTVAPPLLGQAGRAVAPWVRRMLPKAAGLFTGGFAETSTVDWLKSGKFDWKKSAALGALSVALGGAVALTPQIAQGMNHLGKQLGMSTSTSADGTLAMPLFNQAEDQVSKAVGGGGATTAKKVSKEKLQAAVENYTLKVEKGVEKGNPVRYVTYADGSKKKVVNGKLAGKPHPKTGVPYNEDGFPVFDDWSKFEYTLDKSMYLEKDRKQFKLATQALDERLQANPELKKDFTEDQLAQISKHKALIDDFTWHHHQNPGRLQLVPTNKVHKPTTHTGGRAIWGGGEDYR